MTSEIVFRDYQIQGAHFLRSARCRLLADEMGVGKTATAILASTGAIKILVICPATAKLNWQREFKTFAGRECYVVTDSQVPDTQITITNYEKVSDNLEAYARFTYDLLIVDEAHYLKNPESARTRAVFGSQGVARLAKFVWCITGTPSPNHAGELWVMLSCFGMTNLSYEGFINRYCNVKRHRRLYRAVQIQGTRTEYAHELKAMLAKCSMRRMLSDVAPEVPEISYYTVTVESNHDPLKDFLELREKVREEFELLKEKVDFEGNVSDEYLLNVLTMLSESISSLRRYHALKKLPAAIDLLKQELSNKEYEKVIIFAIHRDIVDSLTESLKEFGAVKVYGSMSEKAKQYAVDAFQNDKKCRVFVGNIRTAGVALTLTAANQVVFVEQDFVPGNNQQAAYRARRYGQTLPVVCRFVSLPGLDDKIASAVARKTAEISTYIV